MRRDRILVWLGALALAALAAAGPVAPRAAAQAAGRKVLFTSNRDGERKFNIFAMDPDGTGQANLTRAEGMEFDPALSPDGKRIAFTAVTDFDRRQAEIHVMNADGSGRARLTSSGVVAFAPAWSPDGRRIAYSTMAVGEGGPGEPVVRIMDADGRNDRAVCPGIAPVWSPDGKQLLYSIFLKRGGDIRMQVADGEGRFPRPLGPDEAAYGVWSPDGRSIAFMADGGNKQPDLFVMGADGKNVTRLTETPDIEVSPQWSADGKQLYFTRLPARQEAPRPRGADIYAMDADGKNVRRLTSHESMAMIGGGLIFLVIFRL